MFYVKTEIGDSCTVKTDITDENVFTICPKCGIEYMVDIVEMIKSGEVDLYGTAIYCPECSGKIRNEENQTKLEEHTR